MNWPSGTPITWPSIIEVTGTLLLFSIFFGGGSDTRRDLFWSLGGLGWFLIAAAHVSEHFVQTDGHLIFWMAAYTFWAFYCGALLGRAHFRWDQRRKTNRNLDGGGTSITPSTQPEC